MERFRLLALSTHADSPGQRFRIRTWTPYLASQGIETTERPFATASLQRLLPQRGHLLQKALQTILAHGAYALRPFHLERFDAVYVYREALPLGPALVERWLGSRGSPPIVYDIDDPIFLPQPGANVQWLRASGKWKHLCEMASLTICVNDMIAEVVRPYARRVAIVPNAIDLERYTVMAARPSDVTVLGFSGSHSTIGQLGAIRGALTRVARTVPIKLHILGGTPRFGVDDVDVVLRQWSPEAEVRLLHEFDIGLAPAPIDRWNEYKSFVKVLLYMAVGLPTIATRVGLPKQVIRDGENGFLATAEDEWAEKLILLVRSPDLRRRMGEAARETIEDGFDLAKVLPHVASLLRVVSSSRPSASA